MAMDSGKRQTTASGDTASTAVERAREPALADRLVARLEAGGRAEAAGVFEVDRDQAKAKLAAFQLPDPHVYVLLLVQAAVRQQAKAIDLVFGAAEVSMRFDGLPFGAAGLSDLEEALLAPERAEDAHRHGLRELAVALNTLMGLGVEEVRVRSGDREGYAELTQRPGAEAQVREVDLSKEWPRQAHWAGTVVEVRRSLGASLRGKAAVGMTTEERLVRERCHAVPAKISIHNELVFGGLKLREAVAQTSVEHAGFDGVAGFLPGSASAPELRVVRDGVWVHSVELDLPTPGFVALVRCDALQVDLSRFGVVRDARWHALQEGLREAWRRSVLKLEPIARRAAAAREPEKRWARDRLMTVLNARRGRAAYLGEEADSFGMALAALRLWSSGATARGSARPVSLNALFRAADRGEPIPWVVLPIEAWAAGWDKPLRGLQATLCLRLPNDRERAWLAELLPGALTPLREVDRDVHAQLERHLAAHREAAPGRRLYWILALASAAGLALVLLLTTRGGC